MKRLVTALLFGGLIWGCSNDPAGPGIGQGPGPGTDVVSQTEADLTGDTFGNRGVQWDITGLTVTRDTEAVTVVLEFSTNLISPTSGDTNAMIGFVDFDTDQDSATGARTIVDQFRRDSGSTGMSTDFSVVLTNYRADSTVNVFDEEGIIMGQVKPIFSGKKVTVRIPRSMLRDDDGFLNAAAIVGTQGSPTDIAPNRGHLELSDGRRPIS